jgi:hypothetical protein
MGRQIGYAGVSTDDLHGKAQKAALEAVPCDLIFSNRKPVPIGSGRSWPELSERYDQVIPSSWRAWSAWAGR